MPGPEPPAPRPPGSEPSAPPPGWLRLLLPALGALILAWAAASLAYPFGWDQGIFAWVGSVIREGGVPYRDAWEIKGPATYYTYAAVQVALGPNLWGIRLLDLGFVALAAIAVFRVTRALADRTAAASAAVLVVLWFASLTFWHSAQPDGWVAALVALGVVPFVVAGREAGLRHDAGIGLLLGIAVLFKPNYAAFALIPAVHRQAVHGLRSRAWLGHLAVVGAGMAVPVLGGLAWLHAQGALPAFLECHLEYNRVVYSSGAALDLAGRAGGVLRYLARGELLLFLLPAVAWGLQALWSAEPLAFRVLATWVAVAFAGVVLQNKFFAYQWAPLFPPCAVLAALGTRAALAEGSPLRTRRVAAVFAVLALLRAVAHPAIEVANAAAAVLGVRDRSAYYHHFGVPGPNWEAAQHLRREARPGDRLTVFGWDADILYMSGLETVSRFGYSLPLMLGEGSELRRRYRAEFLEAFDAGPPEFLVVAPQAAPLTGRVMDLSDFPELAARVESGYRREAAFGDRVVYRRAAGER